MSPIQCLLLLTLSLSVLAMPTTYTIDPSPCFENLQVSGNVASFALDGHIRGPLVQELLAHFASYNPKYNFTLVTTYAKEAPGDNVTAWHTRLYMMCFGGGVTPLACPPPLVRTWTPCEMRARWRRSLSAVTDSVVWHAGWPKERDPMDGDVPPM